MWSITIRTSATVLMISVCPGVQASRALSQRSAALTRITCVVIVIPFLSLILLCLTKTAGASVAAEGFLPVQVAHHVPLHLLQTLALQTL
ncbi:Uncharacterised protein [Klebsiella pneumoniae]|nr:Uncharacterised protein [Klebsiella pneumoniae]